MMKTNRRLRIPPRLAQGLQVLLLWLYLSLLAISVVGNAPARAIFLMVLGGLALGLLAARPFVEGVPGVEAGSDDEAPREPSEG